MNVPGLFATRSDSRALQTLHRILLLAYGAEERVEAVIQAALVMAGRPSLPTSARELLGFVRAHMLAIISTDLGPRLAIALLDDVANELAIEIDVESATSFASEPSSHERTMRDEPTPRVRDVGVSVRAPRAATPPPMSAARLRTGVLLVDANRFQRSAIARALVGEGCNVRVADTPGEVGAEIASGDPVHVVLLDMDHPQVAAIVEAIVDGAGTTPIVARATSYAAAQAFLKAAGAHSFEVRLKEAPIEEVTELLRRVARP